MADTKQTKILEVVVDNNKAVAAIAEYNQLIDEQRKIQQKLAKDFKEKKISQDDYYKAMSQSKEQTKAYSRQVQELSKEIQNNIKMDTEKANSLRGLRAELSNVTKQYDELSEEERRSAQGLELKAKIQDITTQLKNSEQETGRFYRNVGNYADSFVEAFVRMGGSMGNLQGPIGVVKNGFMAISSTPIIAILGALVTIIQKVIQNLKSSEESMNAVTVALAPLNAGSRLLTNVMQKLGEGIVWVAEKLTALADKLGLISEAMKLEQQLVKDEIALGLKEREVLVENAESQLKISKLKAQAADKSNYSARERVEILREAVAEEEKIAKRELELARERLRIQEEQAKLAENSKEENDALAQSRADVLKAEQSYFDKTKELQGQIVEAEAAARAEMHEAIMARLEAEITLINMELSVVSQGEDELLSIRKKAREKEYEQAVASARATIKDREELNRTLTDLEEAYQKDIAKLTSNAAQEQRENESIALQKAARKKEYEIAVANARSLIKNRNELDKVLAELDASYLRDVLEMEKRYRVKTGEDFLEIQKNIREKERQIEEANARANIKDAEELNSALVHIEKRYLNDIAKLEKSGRNYESQINEMKAARDEEYKMSVEAARKSITNQEELNRVLLELESGYLSDIETMETRYRSDMESGLLEIMKESRRKEYELAVVNAQNTIKNRAELNEALKLLEESYLLDIEAMDKEHASRAERESISLMKVARQKEHEIAVANAKTTIKDRDELNDALIKLESSYLKDIVALNSAQNLQESQRRLELQKANREKEHERAVAEARYSIKDKKALDKTLALLEEAYLRDIEKLEKDHYRAQVEEERLAFQNRMATYEEGSEQQLVAAAALKKYELDTLARLEEESDAQFEARRIEAEKAYADAEKALSDSAIERARQSLENKMSEFAAGSLEQIQAEIELRKYELESLTQEAGESNEAFYARRLAAQKAYNDAAKSLLDEETRQRLQGLENQMNALAEGSLAKMQAEIELRKAELDEIHQMEEESDADFYARKLAVQQAYNESKKSLADEELMIATETATAIGDLSGALGDVITQLSRDNKAAAKISKTIALAQIAIETGVATAKGISSAMSIPYPANLAAVATTLATVLSGVASAISTVKSAKFAAGGYVSGPGTATSDSIPAMLSNGESVMNARTTAMFSPLLSSLNQAGGGVAFNPASGGQRQGFEFLAAAVAAGMKDVDLHVGVDEVTRVQKRVATINEISSL